MTVNVTYLVGSRHEGYGETGMAHLLEHMLFKGTPRHRKIWSELDDARRALQRLDLVRPHQLLRDARRHATRTSTWALDLEADRMVNASIVAGGPATEFSVVRNEFEMGENEPGERAGRAA